MYYSTIGILGLLVHLIVNYDVLKNKGDMNMTPARRSYRLFLFGVMAFYVADAFWGVLYDAHRIAAVYADTVIYFIAMNVSVYLWARYVTEYLNEKNVFTTVLSRTGLVFMVLGCAALAVNFFVPVLFRFDEAGEYHAGSVRYVTLSAQVLIFLLTTGYAMFTAARSTGRARHRYHTIGAFGVAMTVMVILQVLFPLLPMYSVGYMLGTCLLHTFVLGDEKEARRLELEQMYRRELQQQKELGSAKQLAYTDSLTGVKNKRAYADAENRIDRRILSGELQELAVVVFDVNGLKRVNDTRGHEAGDEYLREACMLICRQFKHSPVYRIGGDEFVALLEGEDYAARESLLEEFEHKVERNLHTDRAVVSSGIGVYRPGRDESIRPIFERADRRMYDRKSLLKTMSV